MTIDNVLDRLSDKSVDEHYNPYTRFDWPESVDENHWWMGPEYLTLHGTDFVDDEQVLKALARRETVNFFSLHVHGIRELMIEVSKRIHTPEFSDYSEYLHHFIGEENAHMWFFAEYCNRYAGGIYPEAVSPLANGGFGDLWDDVIVFSRILIFEEIFDYFNTRLGRDERIPAILRELHSVHHHDESRHVAFGKQLVAHLHERAVTSAVTDRRDEVEKYIKDYMTYSVHSLYSPHAYKDAGVPSALRTRRLAMEHPNRIEFHRKVMNRVDRFFVKSGVFNSSWGEAHGVEH